MSNEEIENWGMEISIDMGYCNPTWIKSEENIIKFTYHLIDAIDMKIHGEPWLERFGEGNKFGITLLAMISTSNISCHFVEESNTLYFNLFSCKSFDIQTVKDLLKVYFGTDQSTFKVHYMERQA